MGKITTDVSNLAEMSGSGVLSFFESFVALSIYLVAMLMIDPLLCLVSFIPLPLIAVFTNTFPQDFIVFLTRLKK